jgi:anti-sigma regulatory factor (Ser/Thr protein kinase)
MKDAQQEESNNKAAYKELKVRALVGELDRLQEWLEGILEEEHCTMKACSQLSVVAEELFVNIARYAYRDGSGTAVVRVEMRGPVLTMSFEDEGVAFNPLDHPMPDTGADIDEQKIGGWGIYMTRKWMDKVAYERVDNKNLFTIEKKIRDE